MDSQNRKQMDDLWSEFVSVLGNEYMLTTGYGVYAHLTHRDINQLFDQFLKQSSPLKSFVKETVRKI